MPNNYSHDDLVERLNSPGWRLVTEKNDMTVTGSLEDMVNATHQRRQKSEAPGLIQEVETSIELEMLQIEMLWQQLGLPTV